jgi:type 1 fimbria pilin
MKVIRGTRVVLAAAALLAVGATVAAASIPERNGTIHGCYDKKGNLRVVPQAADCAKNETALDWNQGPVETTPGPLGTVHFANVTADGNLEGGDAIAAQMYAPGRYQVTFAVPLERCAATVTPGATLGGTWTGNAIGSASTAANPNVFVDFVLPDTVPQSTDFHLIVAC